MCHGFFRAPIRAPSRTSLNTALSKEILLSVKQAHQKSSGRISGSSILHFLYAQIFPRRRPFLRKFIFDLCMKKNAAGVDLRPENKKSASCIAEDGKNYVFFFANREQKSSWPFPV